MVALTQQLLAQHFPNSFEPNMSATPSVMGSEASSAELPAAKKARIMKPSSFEDLDVEQIVLNAYKLPNGKNAYTPMLEEMRLRFDLTPKGAVVKSTWGFDTKFRFDLDKKPAFLGGSFETKNECLAINVQLITEQAAFITSLDFKVSREFASKAGKGSWQPAVKFIDNVPMVKVRVQLNSNDPTDLKVLDNGSFHKGTGWTFLKPWMEKTHDFGPCKAKVVLVAARVWELGGRAGLCFKAAEMTLMSVAKPRSQFESAQEDEESMMADFMMDD